VNPTINIPDAMALSGTTDSNVAGDVGAVVGVVGGVVGVVGGDVGGAVVGGDVGDGVVQRCRIYPSASTQLGEIFLFLGMFWGKGWGENLSLGEIFRNYGTFCTSGVVGGVRGDDVVADDSVGVLPDGGISNDLSVSTSSTHAPSSSPSSFPSAPIIMGVILITTFFVFVR
jgi:hypothetical protein